MHGCLWNGLGGWGMGAGMLLVAGVVIVAVLLLRRPAPGSVMDRRDSLEILKRRLVAGEISVEEFEALKKYL